jgi:predicted lysophospholipase L1 biosynthesis ABC-type transport system permease subunit
VAIVGIYGVLSHAVTRRTREIGIRMAVGAVPSRVLAMILRQSLMVTGTGAVIGLLMAAGTTRYLESMLFDLTPLDPWTFLAVAAMALVVALPAAYPPAARASRVDPLIALRHDLLHRVGASFKLHLLQHVRPAMPRRPTTAIRGMVDHSRKTTPPTASNLHHAIARAST